MACPHGVLSGYCESCADQMKAELGEDDDYWDEDFNEYDDIWDEAEDF